MHKFIAGTVSKYCAAAIAVLAIMQTEALRAGGWYNAGPSGKGGSIFIGEEDVLALSPTTTPALSGSGGDIIILKSGGFALGTTTDTIIIKASNDTLFNSGTIAGANGSDGHIDGREAIHAGVYGTLANDTIFNHGLIEGGSGSYETGTNAGKGGDAVHVYALTLTNSALNNYGSIVGGNGGNGASESGTYDAGNGGDGFHVYAGAIENSSLLYNAPSASITGGNGGIASGTNGYGGNGGSAVYVVVNNSASNAGMVNAGTLTGGSGGNGGINGHGGNGGDGIYIDPSVSVPAGNNFIINTGIITGGAPGAGGLAPGNAGAGIFYLGSNASVVNFGSIYGGNGSSAYDEGALDTPSTVTKDGEPAYGRSGAGVYMGGDNDSVINTGFISGGSGGIEATVTIDTVTKDVPVLNDVSAGVIMQGNNDTIINGGGGVISGGNGGIEDAPVIATTDLSPTKDTLTISLSGAPGVFVDGNNDTVINGGVINGGFSGTNDVTGIATPDSTSPTHGSSPGGTTPDTGAPAGRAPAILMEGNNNTVVLAGHSTTNGVIEASGLANTNKLVLSFTGVSPAEMTALKAQLEALGVLNGEQSSGTFNFRGTTIAWDPLVVVFNLSSYQLQALTPNQASVAANLDSFTVNPTGDMLTVLNALDASGNVPAALEALSPQRYQIYGDIALAGASFSTLQIDERLNNLRDGSESIDTTGIGGDTAYSGGDELTLAGLTKDDGKDEKDEGHTMEPPVEKHWGFFASGDAIFGNFGGDKDLSTSQFTTSGLMLGLDGKVNEHWVLGTYFDYLHTSATMDNLGSKANVSSYSGGLYSGYHNGGYYANGLLGYTRNDYDSSRAVIFPGIARVAQGSTNGNQFEANLDGGYDFILCPHWTAGPIAGLQYVHLGVDDFDEAGAGAADLAVNMADVNSLRSRLGARIEYKRQIGKEVAFAAEGRAEWQHEFLDDSSAISGDFIGSGLGGFAVQTTAPQRDAALVGAGLNVTIRDRMTIFTDYDVQAGQSSWFEQSIRAGLKFSF